jgi:Spy/CpxP family protein refolding chaperone
MSYFRVPALIPVVITAVLTTAIAPPYSTLGSVSAQPRPQSPELRWIDQLNLRSDQARRIEAIQDRYRDRIEERRRTMQQALETLRNLMAGDTTTQTIRGQYRQVESLRQELAELQFERVLAIREVLTPQQRSQLVQIMEQHHRPSRDRLGPAGKFQRFRN